MSDLLSDVIAQLFGANAKAPQQDLFADIAIEIQLEMEAIGAEIVADIQDSLSVEVEPGPPPVHSSPGEKPRKDSGELQNSIQHNIDPNAGNPALTVYSDCEYAPYLEDEMRRPFMLPAFEKWADVVADRIAQVVSR